MNSCICKKFLSGFVILLLLFVMGMFQQAQAIPTNPPADPPKSAFIGEITGPAEAGVKSVDLFPDIDNPSFFLGYGIFSIVGDYEWIVRSKGKSWDGEDFSILQPHTKVCFTFISSTKAATATILPVLEPSSIILIASLLIGFVGVKKGQMLS